MRESLFETVVGLVVVAVAATFLIFSLNQRSSATPSSSAYELHTNFRDAGGLGPGTDVIFAGVKVGSITKVELLPNLFAKVTFNIRKDLQLPKEYKAQIQTDSLMGGAHLGFTYVANEDGELLGNYAAGDEVDNVGGVGSIMSVISNLVAGPSGVNASPTPTPAPTE